MAIRTQGVAAMLLGATLACAGGCGGDSRAASVTLTRAQQEFARGDYTGCTGRLATFIRTPNRADDTAEALYLRGQCQLRMGHRADGVRDLQAALKIVRDATLRALIEAQLGNVAYDDGDSVTACRWYRRAVIHMPAAPPADRVLFQYGSALQRTGSFADARKVLARVYEAFPGSAYAGAARDKHDWDKPYFAVQCGAFDREDASQAAASELRGAGLPARALPEVRAGRRRYVVRVGQYRTYAEAERMLGQVRGRQPDAFVVP